MSGRAEHERQPEPSDDARQRAEREGDATAAPSEPPDTEPGEPAESSEAEAEADAEFFEVPEPESAEAGEQPVDAYGAEPSGDPEQLAAALAEAQRQRDEYLDLLRRERAEFENFRKRANRERMEALDRGAEGVINDLLAVLDDFDRVMEAAERSEDSQLAKGIEMVHSALRNALAGAGLESVPGAGAPFDPNVHEAMMQVEADEEVEQPVVFEVLRPGYRFKSRVLRPASVSVAQ